MGWVPAAVLRLVVATTDDMFVAARIAHRRGVLHLWWQVDQMADGLAVWTGRQVATAYDRCVEAEDHR